MLRAGSVNAKDIAKDMGKDVVLMTNSYLATQTSVRAAYFFSREVKARMQRVTGQLYTMQGYAFNNTYTHYHRYPSFIWLQWCGCVTVHEPAGLCE